jgi:lipid A ethanolaminephosphotransferase
MQYRTSDRFTARRSLDPDCLREHADVRLSDDSVFHSMLGLGDVTSGAYDHGLDLFASCTRPPVIATWSD